MLVMMRWPVLLQMCTKQGFMPADVLSEATRHAERLVELAPGDPASHELRSYVHMHNTEQDLDIACGYAMPSDCHARSTTLFSNIEFHDHLQKRCRKAQA